MSTISISNRNKLALLLIPWSLAACPRQSEQKPDTSLPLPPASATAAETSAPGVSSVTAPAAASSELPRAFAQLGGRCDEVDGGASDATMMCSASGEIVGIWVPVDYVKGVPPAAEIIREEPRRDVAPGRSLTVALEGERLWIQAVSCGACRRIMGHAFVGLLPRLTEKQLQSVQQRIGIPETPVLSNADQWRDYYRDRPLPPLPDGATPIQPSP